MKRTRLSDIFNADSIRNKKRILDRFEINKKEKRLFLDAIEEIKNNGGGSNVGNVLKEKDCNFYDYDGTLLYSYTKEEALALTELPPLPTQPGLICQEWNYTFEDMKSYVADYGVLNVGATYITDDGKTRLYITIAAEGRMDVPLRLQQSVSEGVIVDWGDGNTETFSGTSATTLRHTYSKIGDYVISLEVVNGTLTLKGSGSYGIFADLKKVYSNMLQKVEIGNSVTSIGNYAFYNCYSLVSIVIPNSITSIEGYTFSACYSLASVVIPNSVTSIAENTFDSCYSLALVVITNNVTSIEGYTFYGCYSLISVVIPNSVISIGTYAFSHCFSLASVVIPNNVTNIGNNAFYNCYGIASVVIPSSVTSLGSYALYYCFSLTSFIIPNSITSIEKNTFDTCYSLTSIVIPNNVTSIGNKAFSNCSSVALYDFRTHTLVPTLSSTNAFEIISYDCKIVVPDVLYDEWIAATNWSNYTNKIIKTSEYEAQQ